MHLADQSSLQLFEAFARSIGDTRLLVIATCRDEEARARRELCSALAGAWPHVQRLELEGLGVREVGGWLESVATRPVPDGVIAALHSSTGGFPLLLENLLRAPETEWNNEAIAAGTLDGRLPQRVMRVLSPWCSAAGSRSRSRTISRCFSPEIRDVRRGARSRKDQTALKQFHQFHGIIPL